MADRNIAIIDDLKLRIDRQIETVAQTICDNRDAISELLSLDGLTKLLISLNREQPQKSA
jgi:hypothetical protein